MPSLCSIKKCRNKRVPGCNVRFFQLPTDKSFADKWLRFCKPRKFVKNVKVCSDHFLLTDYNQKVTSISELPKHSRVLSETAIPSLNLPSDHEASSMSEPNTSDDDGAGDKEVFKIRVNDEGEGISIFETVKIKQIVTKEENATKCRDGTISVDSKQYYELKNRLADLEKINEQYQGLLMNLEKIFTPGQIRRLLNSGQLHWEEADIAAAITLQSLSSRAYEYLKTNIGMPLPGQTTIKRWINRRKGKDKPDDGD